MGKGLLAGGIVLIVIGIIISTISSSAQSYSSQQTSQCGSFTGQLGQALSNDQQQRCQTAATYQSVSSGGMMLGWGLALIGVVLAGVGGIQMAKRSGHPTTESVNRNEGDMLLIREGKIFCRYCGKLRPVAGTLCSECSKPTVSTVTEVKKCNFCMASMSSDSEFCANCGRKF